MSSYDEEKRPIFNASGASPGHQPIWRAKKDSQGMKLIVGGFLGFVVLNLVVSIIVTSIQSWKETKLYILLLVSLLAFSQIQFVVVFFLYKEYLATKHFYAIFVIGIAVIIECISTDILAFTF